MRETLSAVLLCVRVLEVVGVHEGSNRVQESWLPTLLMSEMLHTEYMQGSQVATQGVLRQPDTLHTNTYFRINNNFVLFKFDELCLV